MPEWTTRQEEILRERCYEGAEAVSDAIYAECGIRRSPHSIETHASRIHVSLRRLETCPECGRVAQQLNRKSGMCAPCTEAMHVDEELVFNELLMAECRQTDENCEEVQRLRREYARLRQAKSRLCRKYRLQGKRGRK